MIRIGGEFAGGPLYRYLGYQEASDLHANYREGTVADLMCWKCFGHVFDMSWTYVGLVWNAVLISLFGQK